MPAGRQMSGRGRQICSSRFQPSAMNDWLANPIEMLGTNDAIAGVWFRDRPDVATRIAGVTQRALSNAELGEVHLVWSSVAGGADG